MARIDDMIDEPEHPYLGAEFGRHYVDPSTATNAQQAGEIGESNLVYLEQKQGAVLPMVISERDKLKGLIVDANKLIECYVDASDPQFYAWKDRCLRFLAHQYGTKSFQFLQFKQLHFSPVCYGSGTPKSAWNDACVRGLKKAKAVFEVYLKEMDEEVVVAQERLPNVNTRKVFIVHGHDAALKLSVARLMEKVGIEPMILSEQPNCGSTIIEKIEKNSDVGAAICLFTADDECKDGTKRARQNVVLETGYFWGKLGRDKMVILADKGVELPSDMQGVVYTDTANWRFSVCTELKQMGYDIDLNRVV